MGETEEHQVVETEELQVGEVVMALALALALEVKNLIISDIDVPLLKNITNQEIYIVKVIGFINESLRLIVLFIKFY